MSAVNPETGEVSMTLEYNGQTARTEEEQRAMIGQMIRDTEAARAEQLEMQAPGMGRFEGVPRQTVLVESQWSTRVTLEQCGDTFAVTILAPGELSIREADTLRGMLDRAVKAAKAAAA